MRYHTEDHMPMFMCLLNWTEQGIRSIKEVYLTSGDSDLLLILDTPNGDNVAKFALAIGSLGSVRTRTARIWPQSEYLKMISELP